MRVGQASGVQIAFFTFALLLLAVPISRLVVATLDATGQTANLVGRAMPFAMFLVAWALIPPLRRAVSHLLADPIPPRHRAEVAAVALASISLVFVYAAGLALWVWATEGPAGVERRIFVDLDKELERHLSPIGIATNLFFVAFLGPIIEEVIFRGFLYRAFEKRWGWIAAMILSSTLFGLYHPHFYAAFTTALVLVCVMRKTGSLWSAIAVHMTTNLALWWPLAGQFVFPHGVRTGELSAWYFHIACAIFVAIALPTYVWLARDRYLPPAPNFLPHSHAALPK